MNKLILFLTGLLLLSLMGCEEEIVLEMNPMDPASGLELVRFDSSRYVNTAWNHYFSLKRENIHYPDSIRFVRVFRNGKELRVQLLQPGINYFPDWNLSSGQTVGYQIELGLIGDRVTKRSTEHFFTVP